SVLGSAGQSNYAAANTFLDALAWYRRGQGQVALSINWGPWSQVGLAAAERQRGERLEHMGMGSISPEQGLAWLEALLRSEQSPTQVGIWPFHLRQWEQSHPAQAQSPLFAALRQHAGKEEARQEENSVRQQLQGMRSEQERQRFLENYLQEQMARILAIPRSSIDKHAHFSTLGLDSLMAIELRNSFEMSLQMTFPVTLLWTYSTIAKLAPYLLQEVHPQAEAQQSAANEEMPSFSQEEQINILKVVEALENLSIDELQSILSHDQDLEENIE
ncbi:MAG: KR domain-containing protein, partial [Ktedonobacteraceae bacterium]|nr:KR domain-containing protein [Ktedonobacteraceae bacterium]